MVSALRCVRRAESTGSRTNKLSCEHKSHLTPLLDARQRVAHGPFAEVSRLLFRGGSRRKGHSNKEFYHNNAHTK